MVPYFGNCSPAQKIRLFMYCTNICWHNIIMKFFLEPMDWLNLFSLNICTFFHHFFFYNLYCAPDIIHVSTFVNMYIYVPHVPPRWRFEWNKLNWIDHIIISVFWFCWPHILILFVLCSRNNFDCCHQLPLEGRPTERFEGHM